MEEQKSEKTARVLGLYTKLLNGHVINKNVESNLYGVNERSIERDIEALRLFLAEQHLMQDVVYDRRAHGYRLVNTRPASLSNSEILAVCKILLESRSMRRDEMMPILDKLIDCCVPEESKRAVTELIANEKYHYIPPHHGKNILPGLWELGQAIAQHQVIEMDYERMKEPKLVCRRVKPVGILFSEYYFYLTAFREDTSDQTTGDDLFPTIYRLDRIQSFTVTEDVFSVPYKDRFQEGEFRKRVQFMYGGKLQTVRFQYSGPSIEAVLDRLPTAEVTEERNGVYTVRAEVFGSGIDMWLRSQGDYVTPLEK
jgi:predicted DNA-binding transcriptional regulator YafY